MKTSSNINIMLLKKARGNQIKIYDDAAENHYNGSSTVITLHLAILKMF
jgi:hypothetical protein